MEPSSFSEQEKIVAAFMSMPTIKTDIGIDGLSVFTMALRNCSNSQEDSIATLLKKYEPEFDMTVLLKNCISRDKLLKTYFKNIAPMNMGIYIKECGKLSPEVLKQLIHIITSNNVPFVVRKDE